MVTSLTSQAQSVPFTHEHFLLGSYREFLLDRIGFLLRLAREGDVRGFRIGPVPLLFFNKAEYAQHVLVEHADDFSKGKLMRNAVGNNGLFVSEGEFHRRQRKLMAPAFSHATLPATLIPLFTTPSASCGSGKMERLSTSTTL